MPEPLPIAFRAAWVFPVADPPLPNGVIEIDAAGRIAAVRPGPDRDAIDLGDTALVPALVNAHVHLEFSDLAAPIGPPRPFPCWIKNIIAHRRARTGPFGSLLRRGIDEVTQTCSAAVGEIAASDMLWPYCNAETDIILFRELIGPTSEDWPAVIAAAERHVGILGGVECRLTERSDNLAAAGQGLPVAEPRKPRPGLSPHAPYTVPQELFERAIDVAVRHAAPVAVHLAETAAELELLATGTGELVEMMRSLDLWRPELHPRDRRPLDWLRELAAVPHGLVVHGNYLDDEELDFIAANENLTLVYCPRTHAYFGHPPHPIRRLLDRGGRVALGTDGRSSSPDLDLWREARFLRTRHPDLPSGTILNLATRGGAEALGVADRHGVLAAGRPANFLAVSLTDPLTGEPPDLFAAGNRVTQVFRNGVALAPSPGGTVL